MNKKGIVGLIIFLCIICIAILIIVLSVNRDATKQSNNIVDIVYNMFPDDVDGGINYFRESKEFKNMNKRKQIDEIGILLNLYQNNHIIKNLYYDESDETYTFQYNSGNIKGAFGVVMMKTWNHMMN